MNGTTTNLKTALKTSDAGDPPLELDQLSTGPILKAFQGGILKAQINNAGNYLFNQSGGFIGDQNGNEYLKFTTTASAVNEIAVTNASAGNRPTVGSSGEANAGLNISPSGTGQVFITGSSPVRLPTGVAPSNDDDAARKKYVDDKTVSFSIGFFILDPATANLNVREFGSFIVPAGGTYTFTKGKVMFREGSHTSGGSLTFKIDQAFIGDKSTLTLDNTNNTVATVYTDDFTNFTASENSILSCYISARSGTITEKYVMVVLEGFRTVF